MSLIKISPTSSFRSMLSDFFDSDAYLQDDFFNKNLLPAVNVKETDKNYEIDLIAPGMKKEDFKIVIEKGVLTISANLEKTHEEDTKKYTRREYHYQSFARSFALPDDTN